MFERKSTWLLDGFGALLVLWDQETGICYQMTLDVNWIWINLNRN